MNFNRSRAPVAYRITALIGSVALALAGTAIAAQADGEPRAGETAAPTGHTTVAPAPAPTLAPTPKPCAAPSQAPSADVLVSWKYDEQGDAVACVVTSRPDFSKQSWPTDIHVTIARITAADKGIGIDFAATRVSGHFYGYRAADGVRFLSASQAGGNAEDRLALIVRPIESRAGVRPFAVYLNTKGHCFVDGPDPTRLNRSACHGAVRAADDDPKKIGGKDDELAATCTAIAMPTPPESADEEKAEGAKEKVREKKADEATAKDIASKTFCGRVVATWPLIKERLRVGAIGDVYLQPVQICTVFLERDLTIPEIENASCANDPAQLAHADRDRFRGSVQADTGSQSGNGGSNVAGSSSNAYRRVVLAAAPAASATPAAATGLLLGGNGVFPIRHTARLSATVDKLNVGSLLDRLQQNMTASSQKQLVQLASQAAGSFLSKPLSTGCDGKCPDDSFKKIDGDVFDVIPKAFRAVDSKFVDYQVDLKPVDFSTITNVNYGGKFVLTPLDSRVGLAWYRDIEAWASGTSFHADHDFGTFALGVTHTVANVDPSKVTNPYQIDKAHTVNTVAGAVIRFLPDQALQLYGRYGFLGNNTGARDMLGVLSYSPNEVGQTVNRAGSYWKPFAGIGYRVVDHGYDPLATSYDEFVGTKSMFATAGYRRVAAGPSETDPQIELSITGVRAWDGVQPRYNALTASVTAKLGAGKASPIISFVHTRSNIASSVFARQAPVLVTDADEGRTLLRNDSDTVNVKLNSGIFTFSAGPAWTNAPKKCDDSTTPKCKASYNRQLSYELSADQPAFALDVTAGLAPVTQSAFNEKSVASNQFDVKAVGSYSNWCFPGWRVQPAATFDSNVAENRSSYIPGKLFEARLDFGGSPKVAPVVRFSYKIVNDQSNPISPVASLSSRAFYVGVTVDSASRKFQAHCKNDPKTAPPPKNV